MTTNVIAAHIDGLPPGVRPVVRRLREVVRATLPELREYLDSSGIIRYAPRARVTEWVCSISAHQRHANLGLSYGAVLPDPDHLIEGTGKHPRHVKVRSVEEANNPSLVRLLEEAGRINL